MSQVTTTQTLTQEEDTFALAVIEYGGNLAAAYRAAFGPDATLPVVRARELIGRPEIAKRIQQLTEVTQEHALISLGSHLVKLAEIRDLAIDNKQLKVALTAEKTRGEAAGFYAGKTGAAGGPSAPPAMLQINIGSTPVNVNEWAKKHGGQPVVVDVKSNG